MAKKISKVKEKRVLHHWFGWAVIVLSLVGIFGTFSKSGWALNMNVYNLSTLLLGILSVIDSKKV